MKCFIKFTVFLLLFQYNQGIFEIIKTLVGENVHFKDSKWSKLLKCNAIHNDVVHHVNLKYDMTDVNYSKHVINGDCSFQIDNVNFSHAGEWILESTWMDDTNKIIQNYTFFELHLQKSVVSLPTNLFVVDVGNYITVFPQDEFENVTNCILTHDEHSIYYFDLLNINETNIKMELYGKCGVRLLINELTYGAWTIIQNKGLYKTLKLQFHIEKLPKNDEINKISLVWTRGSSGRIELFNQSRVIYCKIIQPDKQTTVIKNNICYTDINIVSKIHQGLWQIQYLVMEKIDLMEKIYNIQVVDEISLPKINVTVSSTNNEIVHFLCTLPDIKSEICYFTKPDNSILNMPQGIGNKKYEYYGKGYNYEISQKNYSDCGMTIRKPSADDFGLWECSFGEKNYLHKAFVSFFDAKKISTEGAYKPNHVYVKTGDSFTIECPKYAVLEYCSFYYKIQPRYFFGLSVMISGGLRGLASGICRTTVKNANYNHAGNWSCLLGVLHGNYIDVPNAIIVTVTESYLYSNQNVIEMNPFNETTLTFYILPGKYFTFKCCLWIHPNGTIIYEGESSSYSISHNEKTCSLTIKDYNQVNLGKWTCKAELFDNSDEEVLYDREFATITVVESNNKEI